MSADKLNHDFATHHPFALVGAFAVGFDGADRVALCYGWAQAQP